MLRLHNKQGHSTHGSRTSLHVCCNCVCRKTCPLFVCVCVYVCVYVCRTPKEMVVLYEGTPHVTLVNLTSLEVFPGPPMPHTMNHPSAGCLADGSVHVIGGKDHSFKTAPTDHPVLAPMVRHNTHTHTHTHMQACMHACMHACTRGKERAKGCTHGLPRLEPMQGRP